jgi:hypothetical protein
MLYTRGPILQGQESHTDRGVWGNGLHNGAQRITNGRVKGVPAYI